MSAAEKPAAPTLTRWARMKDNDIFWSFISTPSAMIAAAIAVLAILACFAAPLIAPFDPFDPAEISLWDGKLPPYWVEGGQAQYLLGTDNQGRDMLSTIMYGGRLSIMVGFAAVALAMIIGILLGLSAGYAGGWYESAVMRVADVQLTIPAILLALLIDGVARAILPANAKEEYASLVLVIAIGLSSWPQYARVVRSATMVEKSKDYVAAARVIGVRPLTIMLRHILPNVLGPVLVIATIGLALAVIAEATLSFLGVGLPPTSPSLGTLIRVGNDFLFSGEWWITLFPALALVILSLAVNLLGDWLRDALNPKLR
jgi:peptide/nickel transport system permease protein